MKSFKEFLSTLIVEGGNAGFVSEVHGEKIAQKIDLEKLNRTSVVKTLKKFLKNVSDKFKEKYKEELWTDSLLDSGTFLSGSAFHLFKNPISDEEFEEHKPKVGDIDLQVDENQKANLGLFFKDLKDKYIIPGGVLYGYKLTPDQYITVWGITIDNEEVLNIQFDFELVDYENKAPTATANFLHSSHWDDITQKLKGAFHKILLRAITDKDALSFWEVMKSKEKEVKSNILSFSVKKGLRPKYIPVIDPETGEQAKHADGKLKFKFVKADDSDYEKNIGNMHKQLFALDDVPNEEDKKLFLSYSGLLQLIEKNTGKFYTKENTLNIINRFIELLFDPKISLIDIDDPKSDLVSKSTAILKMAETISEFNFTDSYKDQMINYYTKYFSDKKYNGLQEQLNSFLKIIPTIKPKN